MEHGTRNIFICSMLHAPCSMIDPISDMLTRIRNATRAGHAEVLVPFSNLKMKIAGVLEKKGFVQSVAVAEEGTPKKKIRIVLKYLKSEKGDRVSYIQGLQRVSRQGQRIYEGKTVCRSPEESMALPSSRLRKA